jgi:hypothetical protein
VNVNNSEDSVTDYRAKSPWSRDKSEFLSDEVASTLKGIPGTLNLDVSSLTSPPHPHSTMTEPTAARAATPLLNLEQPTATPNELPTIASKRPLAHFGQVLPVTKSKANRKLVLQLTPEMYQYFAHVSTLPGLDGVPLPDLAVAILQAWREDYRPEIKKANAAFKA